jgi:hypothetical protein
VDKPGPLNAKPLADLLGKTIGDIFARQGFASRELVTRWAEIAGADIAAHAEPVKIQWARAVGDAPAEPATLVLRVEGPVALEIQHASDVIIARVNRYLGWNAIGRLALRQAPLRSRVDKKAAAAPDAAALAEVSGTLGAIADDDLRAALARLGATVRKRVAD